MHEKKFIVCYKTFVFYLQHVSSPALSSGLIRAALSGCKCLVWIWPFLILHFNMFLSEKTSPFCFDSACLVVFSGIVDNSAGRAFEEEFKGMFETFWSAGCAIQWYRSCIFIAKSFVSPSAFLFCRKPSFQDFGTLCRPPFRTVDPHDPLRRFQASDNERNLEEM